ncbi:MAG: exo-alpha-sialidase [Verrucomicrobiae bacterium]|nr:exo-alpha-sialidase [Verrucomicrobiae bacterium]
MKGLRVLWGVVLAMGVQAAPEPGWVRGGFVYETAPFPQCHASTVVETGGTLVVAWFGGTHERHPDVGIWVSRWEGGSWTAPREVAHGIQYRLPGGEPLRYPTWNPVLFQPASGPLLLFYKAGPSPREWWGMLMTSPDGGRTWDEPRRLPEGILGPVKNKPVQLENGDLLCPSSSEHDGWRLHFERTSDLGRTWERIGSFHDGKAIGAIQPSLLRLGPEHWLAVGRSRQDRVFEVESRDGGRTWGVLTLGTLPNPNSGTDAVTLRDGRHLMVYNHVPGLPGQWGGKRSPLNVAVSEDGRTWRAALTLEDEPGMEFSYPAVIQSADGMVHITYTWKRQRVKHVVLDPARLVLRDFAEGGAWPDGSGG